MIAKLLRYIPLLATAALACSAPAVTGKGGAEPAVIHARPALWAVSDADTTIYLFGTVHMLRPEVHWFEGDVKQAFDRSDSLVVEVAKEDPAQLGPVIGRLAANTDGPKATELLNPKQRARYLAALKAYSLPPEAMDRYDPWYISINLSIIPLMQLGYSQDLGVDKVLEAAADRSGKPVMGFETAEEQLGFFDSLPRPVQVRYLDATVQELPQIKPEFAKLIRHWAGGKADALARQMNDSMKETPELAKPLLLDRNARWADWIEERMGQPGTVFIAVGAGHLAGKGSVTDLLAQKHFAVRRVASSIQ